MILSLECCKAANRCARQAWSRGSHTQSEIHVQPQICIFILNKNMWSESVAVNAPLIYFSLFNLLTLSMSAKLQVPQQNIHAQPPSLQVALPPLSPWKRVSHKMRGRCCVEMSHILPLSAVSEHSGSLIYRPLSQLFFRQPSEAGCIASVCCQITKRRCCPLCYRYIMQAVSSYTSHTLLFVCACSLHHVAKGARDL